MYSEKVMDHFTNPRNVGEIEDANAVGQVGNPKCGDIMKIYMKINDDTQIIEDVKFKTFGCGAAIATLELTNQAVAEALDGLPPIKMHCSNLAEEAVHAAIINYYEGRGIDASHLKKCGGDCCCCEHGGEHNE